MIYPGQTAILCADKDSLYKNYDYLDVWDVKRNAYLFTQAENIIAHPPCAQWSRLKAFAKENKEEKDLAFFCLEKIHKSRGILEHPAGSSFFKEAGIKPTLSVDLSWFGYSCKKLTYLYFFNCSPAQFPISFDLPQKKISDLKYGKRSQTPDLMIKWFLESLNS